MCEWLCFATQMPRPHAMALSETCWESSPPATSLRKVWGIVAMICAESIKQTCNHPQELGKLCETFQETELLRDETLKSDEGLQLLTREYLQPTNSGFV